MKKPALDGVKVLDFGWILVGSLTGKYLGDYGAQVIRVESASRLDITRANRLVSISTSTSRDDKPWFNYLNTSKYSMALDLKHPRAHEILDKLVRWADVVNANFSPGTLDKLGFGYEYMRKINPQIIMAEESVYGQTGPLSNLQGGDPMGAALSGYLDLTGWPDRGPVVPNAPYGDSVLPLLVAMAIVAALDSRRRTGKGQYIDTSMFEVCTQQIIPALLDLQANGRVQSRNGNRIDYAAPHGVFPCSGDDRWCAIAVFTNEEWDSFCHVIGDPQWVKDPKFTTLKARKENEDELEDLVSAWTSQREGREIMQMMQLSGVPAGLVQTAQDIIDYDPQLKAREFLVPLEHPVLGVFDHPNPPFKLLKTEPQIRPAPCFGEHTAQVCTDILNLSDEEFVDLMQAGVFS